MNLAQLTVLLSFVTGGAFAATPEKEIAKLEQEAQRCEHFAGEWDSGLSRKRQREIEQGVDIHCGKAQKMLSELRIKFRDNPQLLATIESFANDSVKSYRQ